MPNLLIITDILQATPRIPGLAKYLHRLGWKVFIITPPLPCSKCKQLKDIKVIKVNYFNIINWFKSPTDPGKGTFSHQEPSKFILYGFKKLGEFYAYPDWQRFWKRPAIKVIEELLLKEKIDLIYSSSSPVTSHTIAKYISQKYPIPWVSEMRDLWSDNYRYLYGKIRRFFDKRLEHNTLKYSDAIITVIEPWSDDLRNKYCNKESYTITNGFDPGKVNYKPDKLLNKFTITYTGNIYKGNQEPSLLLRAIKELLDDKFISGIQVRFYGPYYNWLQDEIEKYNLQSIVKQYGPVTRKESLKHQRESHLLLLLQWESKTISHRILKEFHFGKVFEYLAARRPILVTGGEVLHRIVHESNSGVCCQDLPSLKKSILKYYVLHEGNETIKFKGDLQKINKHSYQELAKELDKIFMGIIG